MIGIEESMTLGELVMAAQSGSREAFAELIARYRSQIVFWAFSCLGDWGEAEDICQDVSLRAWRRLHQVAKPEAFSGWLRTMTRRMAYSRRSRRTVLVDSDLAASEGRESREIPAIDSLVTRDTQDEVREGLQRLGDLDRKTLVAFYIDEMSIQEMSVAFDAPLGTIKRRLHVARHRLAEQIQSTISF